MIGIFLSEYLAESDLSLEPLPGILAEPVRPRLTAANPYVWQCAESLADKSPRILATHPRLDDFASEVSSCFSFFEPTPWQVLSGNVATGYELHWQNRRIFLPGRQKVFFSSCEYTLHGVTALLVPWPSSR